MAGQRVALDMPLVKEKLIGPKLSAAERGHLGIEVAAHRVLGLQFIRLEQTAPEQVAADRETCSYEFASIHRHT